MSVLINGIEMPKDKAIAVVIHPDGTAYTAEMFAGVCTKYLTDCTAIPVPDHGRLIDGDALVQNDKINTFEAVFAVAEAPTIIPASGGKEYERK